MKPRLSSIMGVHFKEYGGLILNVVTLSVVSSCHEDLVGQLILVGMMKRFRVCASSPR